MTAKITAEMLENAARKLTSVEKTTMGYAVVTPVVYPNGDCISVIVATDGDALVVHDASAASMLVASEGVSVNRDLAPRFATAVGRYLCAYEGGRVVNRCRIEEVGTAIMLVANASRAVADYLVEARRQTEGHFRFAVTERIREIAGDRLRENESFHGASGRSYRVANMILNEEKTKPMAFVLPLPSRQAVPTQFREMYDLHAALPHVLNDSVYDDGSDFRPEEDGWVLSQIGKLTPYSKMSLILSSHLGLVN